MKAGILFFIFLDFVDCKRDLVGNTVKGMDPVVPPVFTDNCPPRDLEQVYVVPPGRDKIVVKWTEPVAIDHNGDNLRVEQVAGMANGGSFNGSVNGQRHQIVYLATDKVGLRESCFFIVYVRMPTCPSLDVFENGQYRCTEGTAPGSSCMFTCSKGFKLNDEGNVTCDYSSNDLQGPVWSSSRTCERISCGKPNAPSNANLSCTNTIFGYQTVCSVQCAHGYSPIGPLYMICQDNGLWSETTKCLKIDGKELQCSSAHCNGHTCILNLNQQVTCNCSHGRSGILCEIPPDYCKYNICMNNGTCLNFHSGYQCSCPVRHSGTLCQISPADGSWSDWTVWSGCSETCGTGSRMRTRVCDSPSPDVYGKYCQGDYIETKSCNMSDCQECPQLNELNDSSSSYECGIYDNYGQKACQISCRNGSVLLPLFAYFRQLICGWPTNYVWLPGEVQSHCVVPINPEGLRLDTEIAYVDIIPTEQHSVVAEQVLHHLKETDCLKSSAKKCETFTSFSNTPNQIGDVTTKLMVTFRILLETVVKKRSYRPKETVDSSLTDAVRLLESTADYVQNYTNEVFDVRLGEKTCIADQGSLNVSTSADCKPGYVNIGVLCIICPKGTFILNGECRLCGKGTFQEKEGQSVCLYCPPGQTTPTVGGSHADVCYVPTKEIIIIDRTDKTTSIAMATVMPVVTIIVSIPGFLSCLRKYRDRKKEKQNKYKENNGQAAEDTSTAGEIISQEDKQKQTEC